MKPSLDPSPPPTSPSAPTIRDAEYVYESVLDPMIQFLPLRSWEGITYGMLDPQVGEIHLLFRHRGRSCLLATLVEPDEGCLPLTRRIWAGFMAWYLWAISCTPTGRYIVPGWHLLSTYPGSNLQIPRSWISAARDDGATWGEWKAVTKRIHEAYQGPAQVLPTHGAFTLALRQHRTQRGVPQRARPPVPGAELPDDWLKALETLSARHGRSTASVYRSHTLRVIREATVGTLDPDHCRAHAEAAGGGLRTAWRAFEAVLRAQGASEAPEASTGLLEPAMVPRGPRGAAAGARAIPHLTCALARRWAQQVEEEHRLKANITVLPDFPSGADDAAKDDD